MSPGTVTVEVGPATTAFTEERGLEDVGLFESDSGSMMSSHFLAHNDLGNPYSILEGAQVTLTMDAVRLKARDFRDT
jgi:hypothetical protein